MGYKAMIILLLALAWFLYTFINLPYSVLENGTYNVLILSFFFVFWVYGLIRYGLEVV